MINIPSPASNSVAERALFNSTSLSDWVSAQSVYELFQYLAQRYGTRAALTHVETGDPQEVVRTLTYEQLFEEITRAANVLVTSGASRDGVVALLLPNCIETNFFMWGAECVSSVLPINYLLSSAAIADLMNAAGANILVTMGPDDEFGIWPKAVEVRELLRDRLKAVVQIGDTRWADDITVYDDWRLSTPADRLLSASAPQLDDIAALFHTGGTTGSPKLVTQTHRNQLCAAFSFAYRFGISDQDTSINGLPLFHVGGAFCCGLSQFIAGAHVISLSAAGFRNQEVVTNFWHIVERFGVTFLGGVPTAMGIITGVPTTGVDISSIKKSFVGGAIMPEGTARRFEQVTGVTIGELYGMTEACGVVSTELLGVERTVGTAGFAVPFMKVEAREVHQDGTYGNTLPPSKTGVLVMKGAGVTPGYLKSTDDKEAFTQDGWFVTGDLGSVSADGRIFITGRSKDLIIRSGHNIDPKMIEEVALLHPSVVAAAAVGQPDSYAGEVPVCFVVPAHEENIDVDDLLAFMRARVVERPSLPKRIYVIKTMPVTSVGKIFKPALRCVAAQNAVSELLRDIEDVSVEANEEHGKGLIVTIWHSKELSSQMLDHITSRLKSVPVQWELIAITDTAVTTKVV